MSTETENIEHICEMTVIHLVHSFRKPEMQGPNFSWDRFHEMAAEHCKKQVETIIQHSENKEKALSYAYSYGKSFSIGYLKDGSLR